MIFPSNIVFEECIRARGYLCEEKEREKGKEGIWARHLYKYVIYIRQLDKATHICYMLKAPSLLLRPLQY